ncbi:MAG TPA: porin family protein [Candidatus Krumholzibacteria bacterium]|nr:porin family protein [Candidatus Krumholzibacteria bacterium]
MKRLTTVACAVLLVAAAGQAHAERITAGVMAGGSFAKFGGDDAPDHLKTRSAFMGGGFVAYPINARLGVRGEVLYAQKGAEGDFLTDDGDIHTALYKLDYVDIPVLFTGEFPAGSSQFAFNVFAGPSFNFNVKHEAAVEEHGTLDLPYVKSFEFGAVVGAGVAYALDKFSLIGDVRYSMGVASLADDVNGQSVDVKNHGVGVMGGISFPISAEK